MRIPKYRMSKNSLSGPAVMAICMREKLKVRYIGNFFQINLPQDLTAVDTRLLIFEIDEATWLEREETELLEVEEVE